MIAERLENLRAHMRAKNIDLYLIPGTDPHQNEYIPEAWKYCQYISGFTGSNAEILVSLDKAYLWTDGRYKEQAKIQLPEGLYEAFISVQGTANRLEDFINQHFQNACIGVDPPFISVKRAKKLSAELALQNNQLVFLEKNLLATELEKLYKLEHQPVFIQPESYAGESAVIKLEKLRAYILDHKSEALILNELSSIAWLLNLRGNDIEHNPLFFAYAMITLSGGILFVDRAAASPKIVAYLKKLNIEVRDYQDFYGKIAKLTPKKVLLEEDTASQAMLDALKKHDTHLGKSPLMLEKACKNSAEIAGAKQAHILDAMALVKLLAFLEAKSELTEMSLAEKLLSYRKKGKTFKGESFDPIIGYADHGAIIHYAADAKSDRAIGNDALLLIDSGGQYLEGTTDVTRTVHLGEPTDFEKHCYTLVLKGHLALKNALFPEGTRGEQLDVLARQFLWNEGLNYAHGTGHGVGAFLCVHEGPQRISTAATQTPLIPGMILSNEPGIYFPGNFGIRIENLVYVKKANLEDQVSGEFYTFEDLTLVPYARNLIDIGLLTPGEIEAINVYHNRILKTLSSLLDLNSLRWLIEASRPL